ncbi:histone-lysine N-methyltransferase SETMAR [Elysia marginata]|uniref:Histone-lysine N-methyltransferase SETMAR n=1 Tax=Elysia marginata TaxID=1093978 RepID=A0AAV4JA06_9GAST|nr:histone-lysine N-methyltransferase SETMAR [Elysia marginata]
MPTVFWDTQGVIIVDLLSRGKTVNSDSYIDTLKRLRARILRVRPDMDIGNVLLLHDNARLHTSIRPREKIASFGWTTLPFLSYSPDLTPSDYHLFGHMKQGLRGKHYQNDEEVKNAVKTWMKEQPIQLYEARMHALVKRWNVALGKAVTMLRNRNLVP